ALAAHHFDHAALRVVDQDRHLAAEAEGVAVGHAQGEDGGRGGVGRVAARLEDLNAGVHRALTAGGDGPVLARLGPAARGRLAGLRGRFGLGGDDPGQGGENQGGAEHGGGSGRGYLGWNFGGSGAWSPSSASTIMAVP